MNREFDPAKDVINVARHGVSLAFGEQVFGAVDALHIPSFREEDGEHRWKAIAEVGGKMWTTIYVERDAVRFISVRRSNNGEERLYRNSQG